MRENRILKFRAWDGKTMHNRVEELYLHPRETINIDNGEKTVFDVVLMQFTGLHDVKGVDVYEGDLISVEGKFYREVDWDRVRNGWTSVVCMKDIEIIGNIYEGMRGEKS